MADLKLVGAVAIKVRPDTKGFKKDAEDGLKPQLSLIKAEVKVKVKGDTTEVAKDVEKAGKEIEAKSFDLKIGLDYDSVRRAQAQLDKAVKGLEAEIVTVKLDDEGIAEAQAQIDELAESANVQMTITPDNRGFQQVLDKIAEVRRQKMEIPLEFGVSDEELDQLEEGMKAALFEASKVNLYFNNDRASLQKALDQVRAEQAKLEAFSLEVMLDKESLETAQQALEDQLSETPVELNVNYNDQGSLKAVRDRLQAMLVELGSEKLEVLLNEEAIQQQLDRISEMIHDEIVEAVADPTTLKLNYNINRSSLMSAIGKIDAELDKLRHLTIEPGLNEAELEKAKLKLQADLARVPVELTINYDDQDSLKAARSRLQSMLNETIGQKIDITMDEEKIRAELDKVNALIQEEIPKEKKVEIPVQPTGLEIVARQLQFASRARRVPFYVVVDAKSVAVAEGILRSISGVNTLQSLGRGLESIMTRFDTFSLKTAAWSAAIGGLTDTLFYMTSALFTVAEGMVKVVGLTALLPTAIASIASVMLVMQAVFKDFGAAVNGDQKAIDKLTESGKKAAAQFRTVFQDMRENLSKEFWGKASDAMLRFTETALPAFTRGLTTLSGKLGQVFAGILDSFTNLSATGGLDAMYNNLGIMFENAAAGATAFWDALNLLGLRGSEFLPQFGTWLSDIAIQFNNWLTEADKTGNITTWINEGVTALRDMWYATGALIDQFKAIASAAGLVGQNGLDDFRRNMEHIARVMNAEPWQSQMATVFDGARNGARELMDGFQDLGGVILDSSGYISGLLILLGQLGGEAVSRVADVLGNFEFQQGTLNSLRGLNEMMRELEPGFESFAGVLGHMGDVTAEVFRNLAPVINTAMDIIADVTRDLADDLRGIAPTLLNLGNNLLSFFGGPIRFAAEMLGNLLGMLNGLPDPLKDAAVAFGVFLLLRNQFGAFATAMGGLWTSMTTSIVRGADNIAEATASLSNKALNGIPTNFRKMADGSIREVNRFGELVGVGLKAADGQLKAFKPAAIVTPNVEAMRAAVARDMGRFSDSFANGVTTATTRLAAFAPEPILAGRMGTMAATVSARMSTVAAHVGRGVDTMASHLGRFQPSVITDRLSAVAGGLPGIVGRINGALALIGGLPGIALGLIGVAISAIGQNSANASANIEALRGSLDKFTGDTTMDTFTEITKHITDIDEAGDAFANFWRGVVQGSKAGNETMKDLGFNIQGIAKIITGSKADYDKFIGQMKELGNGTNLQDVARFMETGQARTFIPLTPGDENTNEGQRRLDMLKRAAAAAKGLDISPSSLSDPKMQASLLELTGNIEEQKRMFDLAQLAAKIYGDQLGLTAVKGQQMAAAMAVIRDTSLDATSKIDAMNRAMQLLNDDGLSEQEAAINRADGLARIAENAKNLASSIAQSRGTLFKEGTGLLNDQNAAARALFALMREGADNVKAAAKAAYDAALANGETAEAAMAKAREAIRAGDQDLATIAANAGVTVDELKAQWGKFFNEPWVLEATIMGTSEQFKQAMTEAEAMGIEFDGEEFMSWLLANPDPAKVSAAEVTAHLEEYAAKTFMSKLDALPDAARQKILETTGAADAYARKDYRAVLDAFNNTAPGIRDAAWAIATQITNPAWQATMFSALDHGSLSWVELQLNNLARNRTMLVEVTTVDVARDEAMARRMGAGAARGAIMGARGQALHGFAPKYFANGGIEKHVAQIQRAGGPVRIWAEPETKAEAYIPYALAKRPRSTAILSQVAKDFGYTLTKAQEFANGGVNGSTVTGPTTHTSADVHIGSIHTVDMNEAVAKLRQSQRDALAVAGISTIGG